MYRSPGVQFFTFCLLLDVIKNGFSYSLSILPDNTTAIVRKSRQVGKCGKFQFHCGSGECVNDDVQCDGAENCIDGSDENNCEALPCPSFSFKCAYGACINSDLVCNGKRDCKDNSDETLSRCNTSTTNKCKSTEFKCDSGQCISEDLVCDGGTHCRDGSDEVERICSSVPCQTFAFRCKYGACVDRNDRCNGIQNCRDGSDEDPALCGEVTTRKEFPSDPGACTLPPQITNGRYEITGNSISLKPGDKVDVGTIFIVKCNEGYALNSNNPLRICQNGDINLPSCLTTCPMPEETIKSAKIVCTYEDVPVDCSKPFHGVKATFECKVYYEDPSFARGSKLTRYCSNGEWNRAVPICKPECGKTSGGAKPLIVGGNVTERGSYPWHAAIYVNKAQSYDYICGGSIISEKHILTAAHCFTDAVGGKNCSKNYKIGVGKYYRPYQDSRDTDAQYPEIENILIHKKFRGIITRYESDIAVITVKTTFALSEFVRPVCIDFDKHYDEQQLQESNKGVVIGWGFTDPSGKSADALKELIVPYIPYNECDSKLPPTFRQYYVGDKICAGFHQTGESVCEGDSGGGLVFPLVEKNVYYIRGIVSIGHKQEGFIQRCDNNQYALYTHVNVHLQFLEKIVLFNDQRDSVSVSC